MKLLKPAARLFALATGFVALSFVPASPENDDVSGTGLSFRFKVVANGDAEAGRMLIASGEHGCGACHEIPGIAAARGIVGPALGGFATRGYVAGVLPNEPGALIRFLQDPPLYAPQGAMPSVGLSESDARNIAAYLYTLER